MKIKTGNNLLPGSILAQKNTQAFCFFWLITFLLYIPTAKAGWVVDALGWIYDLKHQHFWDFINRTQSQMQSFYQLYALQYLVCYKLWGMNVWMWSLMYITLHALNASLIFIICRTIFDDSGIQKKTLIIGAGTLLFTLCPHISEVVVYKACFHYLYGFLSILLIILLVQKYQHEQRRKFIFGALLIFFLSAFSLEIFYLAPFFVLSIALYYRFALNYNKTVFKKTVLYFLLPQVMLLCFYFIALFFIFKTFDLHTNSTHRAAAEYLSKPIKYIFHILLFGRYFSMDMKGKVYAFCESVKALILFYTLMAAIFFYAIARFKKMKNYDRIIFLLFVWTMMCIAFLIMVQFPENNNLYVFYDRYTYFADGFIYLLVAMIIARYVNRYIGISIFIIYALINIYFTVKVNMYWKHSAYIDNRLMKDLPDPGTKTVVLLNVPENMNGVAMIGSVREGAYRSMREMLTGKQINNVIYDAVSYNMLTDKDGANVKVINDSTIHVTLNQWGTWWWYEGHGAVNYQNADYKLNMVDEGRWYEMILKHPAEKYLLLYQVGDQWKTVDMNKKNEDQF